MITLVIRGMRFWMAIVLILLSATLLIVVLLTGEHTAGEQIWPSPTVSVTP